MDIVDCVAHREQLIIAAGVLLMLAQMGLYFTERRSWRKQLVLVANGKSGDIHSIDRS